MTAAVPASSQHVERRLLAALDRASARPLVSLLAAHGSGKSALLEQWAGAHAVPLLVASDADRDPHHLTVRLVTALTHGRGGTTPPDLGAAVDPAAPIALLVARIVTAAEDPPRRVAIDEVDRLAGSSAIELLRALCAVPGSKVRLVIASRVDLGLLDDQVRSRGAGTTIDARQLALRPPEIERRLVRAVDGAGFQARTGAGADGGPSLAGADGGPSLAGADGGPSLGALAAAVHAATGGWVAGVDAVTGGWAAAIDADVDRRIELVLRSPAVLASVEAFLLREERPRTRHLVVEVALLDVTDARELADVQQRPVAAVRADLDDLLSRGLLQPGPGRPGYLDVGTVTVSPLVRAAVLQRLAAVAGPDPDALPEVLGGLARAGQLVRALHVTVEVGAQELTAGMLVTHGARLLAEGRARAIAAAAASVGDELRAPPLERLHGEALALLGDHDAALERLTAAGQPDDVRSVLSQVRLLVQRGELWQALRRGTPALAAGAGARDARAELAAWIATAHLRRGDTDAASDALAIARGLVDDDHDELAGRAREATRSAAVVARVRIVAAELATAVEAPDAVYEATHRRAFAAAERADDDRLVAQVRLGRVRHHLDVGRTTEALFELDRAQGVLPEHGAVAEASEARALRAEVLLRTGRIDAAARVADVSRRIDESRHARTSARGWYLLGDVHRQRGALDAARDAYERAIAIAREPGDQHPLTAASIGLARVLARTDATAARRALDVVQQRPRPDTGALLTSAWLALAGGDEPTALEEARHAVRRATPRRDERALAEAATLLALLDEDPVPGLRRAARTWHRLHDPLWAARTELGIARRAHGLDERSRLGDLELRLARLGVAIHQGEVAHEFLTGLTVSAPVSVVVLGGFVVRHGGTRVDEGTFSAADGAADGDVAADRARRMIQLLALRRGRSVARGELLAWLDLAAGETAAFDATVAAARDLVTSTDGRAVALSGTGTAFSLRSGGIDLDLDVVEARAAAGLRALAEGRAREADVLLRAAVAADGGPLLAGQEPPGDDTTGTGGARPDADPDADPDAHPDAHRERAADWARVVAPVAERLDVMRTDVAAGLRATTALLDRIEGGADQGDPR